MIFRIHFDHYVNADKTFEGSQAIIADSKSQARKKFFAESGNGYVITKITVDRRHAL